jgi:carboxymethylenebutenolidase
VSQQQLEIHTADGTIDAVLTRADETETLPGVVVLPDIFGLRPAFADIAERIAARGYVVLTPNIFYRTAKPPVFDFKPEFPSERAMNRIRELTAPLTPDAMVRDASSYIDFLAAQPLVGSGPMGAVGFCFAGQFALRMAGARPDRMGAAASFHGGGLVTDTDQSPHLVLPQVTASLYFGHAENDRGMPAEAIEKLEAALQAWGGVYGNETYQGAGHGWMVGDREVYHPAQADRGFAKLLALFDTALRGAPAAT